MARAVATLLALSWFSVGTGGCTLPPLGLTEQRSDVATESSATTSTNAPEPAVDTLSLAATIGQRLTLIGLPTGVVEAAIRSGEAASEAAAISLADPFDRVDAVAPVVKAMGEVIGAASIVGEMRHASTQAIAEEGLRAVAPATQPELLAALTSVATTLGGGESFTAVSSAFLAEQLGAGISEVAIAKMIVSRIASADPEAYTRAIAAILRPVWDAVPIRTATNGALRDEILSAALAELPTETFAEGAAILYDFEPDRVVSLATTEAEARSNITLQHLLDLHEKLTAAALNSTAPRPETAFDGLTVAIAHLDREGGGDNSAAPNADCRCPEGLQFDAGAKACQEPPLQVVAGFEVYEPVCGCDGQTYYTPGRAYAAGVMMLVAGVCAGVPAQYVRDPCGDPMVSGCLTDESSVPNAVYASCASLGIAEGAACSTLNEMCELQAAVACNGEIIRSPSYMRCGHPIPEEFINCPI